ncbi:hypothetical protein Tco_1054070 [Tanacetum coccineum]|uniref:Uncharacterized protein n=1 Tax=Tanacetum coccineum TaxID=301880 RepID=A0ABQ5GVT6_9ASTR
MLDEAIASGDVNPDKVMRKRDRKTQSKPSSTDKPVNAEEPLHEAEMDVEEPILDDVVNEADQPQDDVAPHKTWFNDLVNAEKDPLAFDELMATPIDFSKFSMNRIKLDKITKADLVGPVYKLLKGTCKSNIELEYNMDQCYNALTDQLDWTNLEGGRCPYGLSKPLPLQGSPCHLTIPVDFFFNNDLEYLKTGNSERKYTTSTTRTKVVKYELEFIEEMIPKLWSLVKVSCNKDVALGISHWGPKRQLFYMSQINKFSKHEVYSTMKILSAVSVKVDKQFGYGYLKHIVMRRADWKMYTFKEGDFPKLHLNDIEDILLLHVQNKLFNLDGDDIVDLAVALRMLTRIIVIQKRVEDVQLGVESYQKKLNITKPQKDFPGISAIEPYTTSFDLKGVLIDKQLLERRIMQSLEGLVGGRNVETDYRLLQRMSPRLNVQNVFEYQGTYEGGAFSKDETIKDDLEVFFTDDLGLDWIFAHNFLTCLQKLSSYASGHLEISKLDACLEKASFSSTSGHVEVF